MERFSRRQWAIFIACFLAYLGAYITRMNLAPALPAIAQTLGLTDAQGGLLATVFAISYAAGQLVSGYFADRVPARTMLAVGLAGSALINLIFSRMTSYPLLLALWLCNGFFQSMLWTPIVRILSIRFEGAARERAIFGISMTLVLGHLLAWTISGVITSWLSWRSAFTVASLIAFALAAVSFWLLGNDTPRAARAKAASSGADAPMPLRDILLRTGLPLVLLCCVLNGYVRDGIMTWAPKMLMDTQGIDMASALGAMLIIPVVNLLGILLGRRVYRLAGRHVGRAITYMMAACGVFALLLTLLFRVHPLVCALLLGLCSAVAYGINPLLTTVMPMEYRHTGRIALVAGMIDASIYVGSAITGVLSGALHDAYGWAVVFASWIFVCAGAVLSMTLASRRGSGQASGQ